MNSKYKVCSISDFKREDIENPNLPAGAMLACFMARRHEIKVTCNQDFDNIIDGLSLLNAFEYYIIRRASQADMTDRVDIQTQADNISKTKTSSNIQSRVQQVLGTLMLIALHESDQVEDVLATDFKLRLWDKRKIQFSEDEYRYVMHAVTHTASNQTLDQLYGITSTLKDNKNIGEETSKRTRWFHFCLEKEINQRYAALGKKIEISDSFIEMEGGDKLNHLVANERLTAIEQQSQDAFAQAIETQYRAASCYLDDRYKAAAEMLQMRSRAL